MLSASAKNKIMTARLKAELELAWNATSEAEALAEARAHALAAAGVKVLTVVVEREGVVVRCGVAASAGAVGLGVLEDHAAFGALLDGAGASVLRVEVVA